MAQYLDLEKAVDYLVDETPEGAPFREGKVFVRGHSLEKKVDPPQPRHGQVFEVIRTGRNDAGEATVSFRRESPSHPDLRILAGDFRLSEHQRCGSHDLRWRYALPLIVRACAEGRWKADGKEPGSAKREDIRARDFIGSEIDEYTGDLMATPGPTSARPESRVAIWTELSFTVPGGTDEGKAAELPELKQDERRPHDKQQRTHDVQAEALLKKRIEGVLAKARAKWPDPQKRFGVNQMARALVAGQPESKVEDYGQEAIRKILAGTYKPAKDRGISGLSSG